MLGYDRLDLDESYGLMIYLGGTMALVTGVVVVGICIWRVVTGQGIAPALLPAGRGLLWVGIGYLLRRWGDSLGEDSD